MDIRQLRYVVAVARTSHFTRAAAELGVAQPALSQTIALLEKRMSVALFDRSGRRVRLTTAGQMFVERAEKILAELDSLQGNMLEHARLLRGRVHLGAMVFFFHGRSQLARVIADFLKLHPDVELTVSNSTVGDSLGALRAGKIDVAIVNITKDAAYSDLKFAALGRDDIAAALPPGHRLGRRRIKFSELRDEGFIIYRPGSTMHAALNTLCRKAGFTPRAAEFSRNIILVRALVSASIGVSIAPKSHLLSPGPPIDIVELDPLQRISITMATRSNIAANPAARAFVTFLHERFRQQPSLFESADE
jgi:LysR family transcriptional regulator, transcription activator of glutamate synthase operon